LDPGLNSQQTPPPGPPDPPLQTGVFAQSGHVHVSPLLQSPSPQKGSSPPPHPPQSGGQL